MFPNLRLSGKAASWMREKIPIRDPQENEAMKLLENPKGSKLNPSERAIIKSLSSAFPMSQAAISQPSMIDVFMGYLALLPRFFILYASDRECVEH
jgi:hypothetical protein